MKTLNPHRESGFTLLELLLVIGVGALLLIGGIATYRLVSDGNKATEATRLLLTIRQETQTMAQQQGGNYTGTTFDTADGTTATGPLIGSGTLRAGQRNPFNGNIVIAPIGTSSENVTVQFTGISQSGCSKLVQAVNNANEVVSITTTAGGEITTFPITAAIAAGACQAGNNDLTWRFP